MQTGFQAEVLRWAADPTYFVQRVLGVETLWEKQIEILEALRDHKRVAVAAEGKVHFTDSPAKIPKKYREKEDGVETIKRGPAQTEDELTVERGRFTPNVIEVPLIKRGSMSSTSVKAHT